MSLAHQITDLQSQATELKVMASKVMTGNKRLRLALEMIKETTKDADSAAIATEALEDE